MTGVAARKLGCRTPIAIVQTRIEGLSEGPERRRLLDDVARLADMAEQLLDFERGNQTIDLDETVDLVDIARTAVADLAPLAIAAGYEMSFHGEAECVEHSRDMTELRDAMVESGAFSDAERAKAQKFKGAADGLADQKRYDW